MNAAYAINISDLAIIDGWGTGMYLRDVPKDAERLRLQAMVASGDYFETLAVRLEQIAATLPATSVEQCQLQEAVGQLLYLQRDYKIAKKP